MVRRAKSTRSAISFFEAPGAQNKQLSTILDDVDRRKNRPTAADFLAMHFAVF